MKLVTKKQWRRERYYEGKAETIDVDYVMNYEVYENGLERFKLTGQVNGDNTDRDPYAEILERDFYKPIQDMLVSKNDQFCKEHILDKRRVSDAFGTAYQIGEMDIRYEMERVKNT